jgi:hypothetical protein
LGLTEARKQFNKLRDARKVRIAPHAYKDHPGRKFTEQEVRSLVLDGSGFLHANNGASAKPNSWMWKCRDAKGESCEIIVLLEQDGDELILVISAWR